ncbi:MAG TPA: alpha-isopropylmalate synthase regulatory domain-containing protein, partial [Bacteroidales bacterium]|nr:alpha-isopropylmalate synthase regulatory domain-containing protein [Bacteroidales bacterium]
MKERIEIMDTTLRDGEQTSGVSFTPNEKLSVAKLLLEEIKVDRIEVASAKVSEGEFESVRKIVSWASNTGFLDRIEVLAFVDFTSSLDWIKGAGVNVANLLTKGSKRHLEGQLRKSPEEHLSDIKKSIEYAGNLGIKVNLYLEDWSNGMKNSKDYVFFMLDNLMDLPIMRFMLPDTLGVLNPDQTYTFCREILDRYPGKRFDFHSHNDYDLATGNVYAALKAGIRGLHTTVNGLGERAGNVPLSSVLGVILDHFNFRVSVNEKKIYLASKLVESFSGIRIPANRPIIGDNVFTQTCGVHADGDSKDDLYYNDLKPERFGRKRAYALGKTAGKANILKNLQELGIELSPDELKSVTKKVIELGDKKKNITTEDLPFIVADVLNSEVIENKIKIINFSLSSAQGLKSMATLMIDIEGEKYEETASGDGQYDAFMKALKKIYKTLNKEIPRLADYTVTIPPGGKTDALVSTVITWDYQKNSRELKTSGLDSDQTVAAIMATM